MLSGLALAVQLAYQRGLNNPRMLDLYDYIPVAFLLLAAIRFGPAGASGSLTVMSVLSVIATSTTAGHPSVPAAMDDVLSMQLFLIVIGIPIMSLSVLIEQQRKTEQSLRESEARFRHMADTAPVMIWISGHDGHATFFNKGWLEFTGRPIEQELGYGWMSGVAPDQRDSCLSGYTSSFDGRRHWRAEWQLRRADGEYRWMLCTGAPRISPDGVFAGYIVSCSDITDLKRVQEASLARQKLESLGVLAGGIAHDFNNLLGSIHANAEIAEAEWVDGSFPAEEIQAIKKISIRASEIVRQLMIYAGHDKSDSEPLDLSQPRKGDAGTDPDLNFEMRGIENRSRTGSTRSPGQWSANPTGGDEPRPERIRCARRSRWGDYGHDLGQTRRPGVGFKPPRLT